MSHHFDPVSNSGRPGLRLAKEEVPEQSPRGGAPQFNVPPRRRAGSRSESLRRVSGSFTCLVWRTLLAQSRFRGRRSAWAKRPVKKCPNPDQTGAISAQTARVPRETIWNPPPAWPRPPDGWRPPAGWTPDPAWGPAPPGWQYEVPVPDTRRFYEKKRYILPTAALGVLVALGALGANTTSANNARPGSPPALVAASSSTGTPTTDVKAAADAKAAAPPLVDTSAGLRDYANCTELKSDYPHGVGQTGAVDKVSGGGAPVTTFTRNDELYAINAGSDRDGDGIACEQR